MFLVILIRFELLGSSVDDAVDFVCFVRGGVYELLIERLCNVFCC